MSGSGMQQSTGHTAAQASCSWKPTHSVHSCGSMTKMSSPWLMAWFGHSGSQAPQLMHSTVIIVDMAALLYLQAAHRHGSCHVACPRAQPEAEPAAGRSVEHQPRASGRLQVEREGHERRAGGELRVAGRAAGRDRILGHPEHQNAGGGDAGGTDT